MVVRDFRLVIEVKYYVCWLQKMLKHLSLVLGCSIKCQDVLLTAENIFKQQLRTTYILKRKFPPYLHKKGDAPRPLRSRHYIYDLVQQTHIEKQPNIDIVLTGFVDGLGNIGDKVSVKPNYAYNNLLLPGLAVYASPENIEKYKDHEIKEEERHSSPNAPLTAKIMGRMLLCIAMNMENPWTLKPWHVKASFRKCGYIVAEDAISLPEKPITGPDMNLQNKEFFVTITINNLEKFNVRCRIHHWSTDLANRLPHETHFWEKPSESIFPEQAAVLESLPRRPKKDRTQLNVKSKK